MPNGQSSEINAMVRGLVEVETIGHPFWVRGIVKNYYKSDLGHIDFTLVDDRKSINCMLTNKSHGNLDFEIRTGLEIEIFGDVQVYEERAEIQIQVKQAKLINANNLPTNSILDQLKDEGLYPYSPRPLPEQIRKIRVFEPRTVGIPYRKLQKHVYNRDC